MLILVCWGTKVFCHIPKQKRLKWDVKSRIGIFVGYGNLVKGYRIYFWETEKIEILRDVDFDNEQNQPIKFEEETVKLCFDENNSNEDVLLNNSDEHVTGDSEEEIFEDFENSDTDDINIDFSLNNKITYKRPTVVDRIRGICINTKYIKEN